jgi:DNA polymerase I
MVGLERYMGEAKHEAPEAKRKKPTMPSPDGSEKECPDDAYDEDAQEAEDELEPDIVTERERPEREEIVERTIFEAEAPSESDTCTLLSVSYNGAKARALLKLYNHGSGKTLFWYDNSGHQPYCLTDLPLKKVLANKEISGHPGFDRKATQEIIKRDLLHDRDVRMTKVVAKDPLSIGGQVRGLRDILPKSWEANIRYHDCYTYDKQLIPGFTYRITRGQVEKVESGAPMTEVKDVFKKSTPEFLKALESWLPLLVSPVPNYRRMALDIEVATEALDRIPDPSEARNQVICVSLAGSDGLKKVVVLKRPGVEEGEKPKELPVGVQVQYFEEELPLLKEVFRYMLDYPIVLTFNGDNFDLHYLWRRAQVLGMRKEEVPILMGREIALLPVGVHFDLYKFFHNHAIQIYAFGNAYREVSLDAIATALIDKRKIHIEKTVSELSYGELIAYCFRDSEITLALTTHKSNLVMNLVTMIMRISRLSMEDVTRQGVSRWIRSLFFSEHRAQNCLIPLQADIEVMKGEASTTAVIKGKKYQGAMVIKPESKVYFDVVVMDFASLYPSIIAKWNLSYETVNCVHPECKDNLVPDTTHWVCKKRVGMMGFIIGLLRDVRVKWFKQKSKDPSISPEERNWYKVTQQAQKVILNASYGVFGSSIFPLYCLPLADSTTAIGRHIIHATINQGTQSGMKVVYGDSVTKDTKIIVKLDNTQSELPIQDLFNKVERAMDEKQYYYPNNACTLSIDAEGKAVWKKIIYVMRHKTKKPVYRVHLTNCWHVDVTEDHSLIGYRNRRSYGTPLIDRHLIEVTPQELGKLVKSLVVIKSLPRDHVSSRNYPTELYEMMGFFIGDGSINKKQGQKQYYINLACGAEQEEIITRIIAPLKEKGWIKNYWRRPKGDLVINGLQTVRLFDKELWDEKGKRIPSFIFNETEDNICSFVRGLFSSDGTVSLRNKIPLVNFCTTNTRIPEKLQTLLWHVGISSSVFKETKPNSYLGKDSDTYSYHVAVKGRKRFSEKIGFFTENKNMKLKQLSGGQWKRYIDSTDFDLSRVVKIESIQYDDYVYDLEVEDTHRFFANGILAHNTDSIFLHQPTTEQITSLLNWADSTFGIDLEVDKRYVFVTFSGRKKNYLGVLDSGVVDIKGLMGKKRNTPTFIKDAFTEMTQVLKTVKDEQDFAKAKTRIKQIVQDCYTGLKARKFSLDQLTFRVMLSRSISGYTKTTPQHVKAAKQLVEKKRDVKPGDIISYVKVQGPLGVKPVQLARIDEVDVDKYVGHIETTFGQVLEALGIEFDDIIGIKKLDFFSR